MSFVISEVLLILGISLLSAFLALRLLAPRSRESDWGNRALSGKLDCEPVFLFDRDRLLDASSAGRQILGQANGTWADLRQRLSTDYDGLPETPEQIEDDRQQSFPARDAADPSSVEINRQDGITRVRLSPGAGQGWADTQLLRLQRELQNLQAYCDNAPYPMWESDPDGQITWANKAYAALFHTVHGKAMGFPEPLFRTLPEAEAAIGKRRQKLMIEASDQEIWFDVTRVQTGNSCVCYATDINAVVRAEVAQRNFVQTLSKTFAQLSIGLAIFDRNRQMALFNPALVDLTTLPADFLSSRPNVMTFFDRLREKRMMPEPKNYNGWRQQLSELVEAASDGRYLETWSLPSGSVYQVSGRPHPDGAVAFLFEDITAEITLTRRFRADLDLSQSVLNHMEDAVAVFSDRGVLTLCNAAYRDLWKVDPDNGFAETTVIDAARHWQQQTKATPIWGEIRDFVQGCESRAMWTGQVETNDGTIINCTIHPAPTGATLIVFRPQPDLPALPLPETDLETAEDS